MLWFSLYTLYSSGPPDIDELKYPLLNLFLKVIKKLATGVDNVNRQSNIKLAIINSKFFVRRYQSPLTLHDYIIVVESVFLEVNLKIKSQYRNDQKIKTFSDCNKSKLYLINLNLLAYFRLYTFRRF